jgi:hypothetical protein
MASTATIPLQRERSRALGSWLAPILFAAGLLLRLRLAWSTFLNPDEALHYFLAHQPSLKAAYEASLTTAHPPLMILFLHFWGSLGSSELVLRLPFVVAGVFFCWFMFLWVREVAGGAASWFALVLCLFLPALVSLSAEIRQYAFLLLFCSSSLYFLERAFSEISAKWMAFSEAALYLALLTHYSSLIFAAALGIYGIIRLVQAGRAPKLTAMWAATQVGALVICAFLWESQVVKLRQTGVSSEIAATWLRTSIFHPGENALVSAWSRTLRLFRYSFSHGSIGVIAFFLFVFAVAALLWPDRRGNKRNTALAVLLLLPFVITLALSFAGLYPYGGTRHDVLLAMFAISGVAIGLDRVPLGLWKSAMLVKSVCIVIALIICNVFASPSGPYIAPSDQQRNRMQQALAFVRSLPPGSTILTDQQSSMVLNYYLCDEKMPLVFFQQREPLLRSKCGDYVVITAANTQTGFDRDRFPDLLKEVSQSAPGQPSYLFQSGWINDKEEVWLHELRGLGGNPRNFGPNILVCELGEQPQPSR